jgi:hypothetical protein
MAMVFAKSATEIVRVSSGSASTEPAYKITRIDGILPRGCLPKEYLDSEDRLFAIKPKNHYGRKRKNGVVILHDKDDLSTEVIKIFPGNVFSIPEWSRIMKIVSNAGNRLHVIRRENQAYPDCCTDVI